MTNTRYEMRVRSMREPDDVHYTVYIVGDTPPTLTAPRDHIKVLVVATHLSIDDAQRLKDYILCS